MYSILWGRCVGMRRRPRVNVVRISTFPEEIRADRCWIYNVEMQHCHDAFFEQALEDCVTSFDIQYDVAA